MTNIFKQSVFVSGTLLLTAGIHSLPAQTWSEKVPNKAAFALLCAILFLMPSRTLGQTQYENLTGYWVLAPNQPTNNQGDLQIIINDSIVANGNYVETPFSGKYIYNPSDTALNGWVPTGWTFLCYNAENTTIYFYNKNKDSVAQHDQGYLSPDFYIRKNDTVSWNGKTYIAQKVTLDTSITKTTSQLFYHDTSITIDTSVTSRDTIGINIVTKKQIVTTITYWQYYFTTTIDSIFTISNSKVLDTTFTLMDTTSTRKQTTTNRSFADTTILLPRMIIRDTVFAMDTLERTDDTVVQGKDTTIIITHSLVLLIIKRDTLPDTAVTVILRDTLVHSGDTTIHIIDTSVIPFVLRDTITASDSITYTLRDTTIIGTDTIIRIHDTTVLAKSSVSELPAIITSGQFSYFWNSFDFTSSDQVRELKIYDMLGRCLFSMQIMPGQNSQSLPYLQSGAYIASLGNQVLKFIRTQ